MAKAVKTAEVCQILEEFNNLNQIADTQKKGTKECISSIVDKESKEVSETKDIAKVFADVYEYLYNEDKEKVYDYEIKDEVK